MIYCQKCKAEIDSDSWYCDQCGEAIMMCPNCKDTRKGKRCSTCGSVLITAEEYSKQPQTSANPTQAPQSQAARPQAAQSQPPQYQAPQSQQPQYQAPQHQGPSAGGTVRPEPANGGTLRPQPVGPSRMVMVDDPSKVVVFRNGAIIGRKMGDYLNVFSDLGYTSSRHAQLSEAAPGQWLIIDLNSTNGTKVDNKMLTPNQGCMLNIGQIVEIGYKKFRVE